MIFHGTSEGNLTVTTGHCSLEHCQTATGEELNLRGSNKKNKYQLKPKCNGQRLSVVNESNGF